MLRTFCGLILLVTSTMYIWMGWGTVYIQDMYKQSESYHDTIDMCHA